MRGRLGLPLIAKDVLKETLGETFAVDERAESQRLGVAVFHLMGVVVRELLAANVSLILEGNLVAGSVALAGLPRARIVQVFVSAEPALLRRRLLERDTHRHPVHYDREAADEVAARAAAGEWMPLPLDGALVQVDTSDDPPLAPIVESVVHETRNA